MRRGEERIRVWLLLLLLLGSAGSAAISRSRDVIAKPAIEEIPTHAWHQGAIRGIMEILGLLANAILTSILQATLDASLTRSFVA